MRAFFAPLLFFASLATLVPTPPKPSQEIVPDFRPQAIARPRPAIQVPGPDGKQVPARLQDLRIQVQVAGSLAITTWDFTLYNPQDRILEGEFIFPLGDGQTVSRFAMDVNGTLREGVVVDKAKGRQAFEEIVRRGVDPGLLEKLEGNVFRARVYPIPARGSKRVVLAYEQELGASAKDPNHLQYVLPLDLPEAVANFSLKVEVLEQSLQPTIASSPFEEFALQPWQRSFHAETTRKDFRPERPLVLAVPRAPDASASFLEDTEDGRYFYTALVPTAKRQAKPAPRRLLVVWDASASAIKRDRKMELALLSRYLHRLGTVEVSLCVFRNEAEPLRRFAIKDGDAAGLRAAIAAEPLDGATAFGALKLAGASTDEILLFSDGLSSLGGREAALPDAPVITVNSAVQGAPAFLRGLAEGRGGEFLDLTTSSVDEALEALRSRPLAFLGATVEQGSIANLLPAKGALVRASFGFAGTLDSDTATLKLNFGFGRTITFSKVIKVGGENGTTAPARRMWAAKRLADLGRDPEANKDAITELGTRFAIVTEGTSLIVLDALEDYVRYRIVPPASMREAYWQRVKADGAALQRQEQDRLDQVLSQWKERQSWWDRTFTPPPAKAKERNGYAALDGVPGGVIGGVAGGVVNGGERRPATLSSPPPPSPAGAPAMQSQLARNSARDRSEEPAKELAKADRSGAGGGSGDREAQGDERKASIQLKTWDPQTPYLTKLKALPKGKRYVAYLQLRKDWEQQPGFFLDVADLLRKDGAKGLALRVLSNLAELRLEDPALFRVLGHRLLQIQQPGLAVWVFDQVKRWRPEEPQSVRDLALACADAGQPQQAANLLWEVVKGRWDGRFRDVNLIALGELNALLNRTPQKVHVKGMAKAFQRNLPVDIRVVLNWDTNDSDMDLHVVDPRGEICFYGHQATALGGRISADVTGGYGPEEFLLKQAIPGRYLIKANYFGTRQQTVIGATTVKLELYLRYGTFKVENKSTMLRLTGESRMVDIGEFVFEPDK